MSQIKTGKEGLLSEQIENVAYIESGLQAGVEAEQQPLALHDVAQALPLPDRKGMLDSCNYC